MTPEDLEDVSFSYVPGSIGSSGTVFVPWTARRTPKADAVRAVEMAKIRAILPKAMPKADVSRLVDSQEYQAAVEVFQREARAVRRQA
jgi:hypothetical protein